MRVLHVSSECAPWAKAGGLGDVVGALPDALRRADESVSTLVVMPLYRAAAQALAKRGLSLEDTGVVARVDVGAGASEVRFLRLDRSGRAPVVFADNPAAFDRDGLYGHEDDAQRFILFSRAVVEVAAELMGGPIDIVHAHDWHTALVPGLIATRARETHPKARTLLTIHNLAYQGVCDKHMMPSTGLGWELFHFESFEFYDQINLLKGGAACADAVTTVSPTYAKEIKTPGFGCGLDDFLRQRPVHGLLNGVDTQVWDPRQDPHIAAPYDAEELSGKAKARAALLRACGWPEDGPEQPGVPLLGIVSRMTVQKGLDLVAALAPELASMPARLVVLGNGDPELEERFRGVARDFPDNVHAMITFDVPLSHRIIAGCDGLLVPSRFEPCGLTQLYAMRYGTVPIVHATGGLADTVTDPGDEGLRRGEGTGFAFEHPTVEGLRWAVGRAVRTYREEPQTWREIQRAGMARDWGWVRSADAYLELYRSLCG